MFAIKFDIYPFTMTTYLSADPERPRSFNVGQARLWATEAAATATIELLPSWAMSMLKPSVVAVDVQARRSA